MNDDDDETHRVSIYPPNNWTLTLSIGPMLI